MTASPTSADEPYEQLRRLLERDRAEGLSDGDAALVRSVTQHILDTEKMNALLAEGFECEPFVEAAAELVAGDLAIWPLSTLTRLTETLLFNGLDREAATIADELRRRDSGETHAIRLWALSAGTPEATMRRFAGALPSARDPAAVISDAREFASRNVGDDLASIIEQAATRLKGQALG